MPSLPQSCGSNLPACHTAIVNDLRGPNNTITHGAVATNMAIHEARGVLLDGDADVMIVGGTGTTLTNPESMCESAYHPAEGAAAYVLERMDAAIDRDADIFAEIIGSGSATSIRPDHRADPSTAFTRALAGVLKQSRVRQGSVSHVSVDRAATDFSVHQAIADSPVVSLLQRTGDAQAGSSAMAVAASLLSMRFGQPPTAETSSEAEEKTVAVNVNSIDSGLASCAVLGRVLQRIAA